jgi:rhodanese-related sulfurtransferase
MKTITTEQVEKLQSDDQDALIIDVLPEDSYTKSHIPGTESIPLSNDFASEVENKAGSKDKPVVVYCASPDCDASPKAAQHLEAAGFSDVYDYEGGMKAWLQSGHKLEGTGHE